jgi:hypothetical protein
MNESRRPYATLPANVRFEELKEAGHFPLDQIASLEVDKGLTNKVRFTFTDGSAEQVECAKLEKVGDFETAFKSGIAPQRT